VKLLRLAIWLATAAFVVMLFAPLVAEMYMRLRAPLELAP
jgi:hypothetical protein